MSSAYKYPRWLCVIVFLLGPKPQFQAAENIDEPPSILRVAADPNNLPFSNERGEGFENKIAELVARDLNRRLVYVWRAQRRGFFRETLKEGKADLVMGVPAGFEMALTTIPYYRSTYVFVSRQSNGFHLGSLDDPVLRETKIGVQLIGDDGANSPPAHAFAMRGVVTNLVGFTVYGDYSQEDPNAEIVRAVASGTIDVGVVWGPFGGYFAGKQSVPLAVSLLQDNESFRPFRFQFSIAMAVQKKSRELRDELDSVIEREREQIGKILDSYKIPTVPIVQKEEH
jgi:quinoprotein dehydrogenase-associated probable ABC transporter substrate-binding protein